jgi:class 3 adenylate cyclase
MMEPRIQYAKTSDGVSIAFWTLGEGTPFVHMPMEVPLSHVELEWQWPPIRRWYEKLAQKRMVVRYDGRGSGLSERGVSPSPDACVLDLEAVADRLGLEKFVLYASHTCGLVAIPFAAAHPERVSHLILWCCVARASDTLGSLPVRTLDALLNVDWETASETWARVLSEGMDRAEASVAAAYMRESTSSKAVREGIGAFRQVDVAALLPHVRAPTLVLCRRQLPGRDNVRIVKELASGIPDARLIMLEGISVSPWAPDSETVARAIDDFLGDEDKAAPAATPAGLVTILFTDMEGSTALTQRLGDAKAQEVLRAHNSIVRDALKACGGSEIKHTGDGIMASFPSASRALECAIAIQRAVAGHTEEHPETPVRVRVGLNAGEPVVEEEDLFGTAVQMARRVCDRAEAGQVLVANVVRELASGKGFLFSDVGDVVLKGFEDPVRLYEARWREPV